MKKNMKKIVSLLLAMVMIFAMSVTTFAAETPAAKPSSTLTINTAEGHTYEVYQMLVGDVSGLTTKGEGTLANVEEGLNLDGTVDDFVDAISEKNSDGTVKIVDGKRVFLEGTALAAAASGKIQTGSSVQATITGDGNAKSQTLSTGYYVVKDKYTDTGKECAAYMVAVVGPTSMSPKTDTPDIDKNITDTDANKALETTASKKTDTAAIGDKIEYESTSTVPVTEGYKYYYYVVSDTMSEGLTYNKDLAISIGGTALSEDEYTITETDRGFELVVKDMKQYTAGTAIVITYSATVNENAKIGTEPNTNTIKLTYSNNPSDTFNKDKNSNNKPGEGDAVGITPERVTKTYVTEIVIKKVDQDGKPLSGAAFTLTGTNLNKVIVSTSTDFVKVADDEVGQYYKLVDGTFTNVAPSTAAEGEEGYNADKYESTRPDYDVVTTSKTTTEASADDSVTVSVDANGIAVITGLNAGEYTLSETTTPTGYTTAKDIDFEISATQTGADDLKGGNITWASDNNKVFVGQGVYEAEIENVKGNLLPSTGGIGTTIFYVLGTVLVLGAGVILVAKRRVAR